jgi:hypothetical protein
MVNQSPVLSETDGALDILGVRNARYASPDRHVIDCEVNFRAYGWVPYTLTEDDPSTHAQALRLLVQQGRAGAVQDYVPPPPLPASAAAGPSPAERLARLEAEIAALRATMAVGGAPP